MNTQGYSLSPGTKNPHSLDSWVFYYQNAVGNKDNIKIEINYSMRNHALPLVEKKASVEFLPSYNIRAISPLELFGSKIKVLLERTAQGIYMMSIICWNKKYSIKKNFPF